MARDNLLFETFCALLVVLHLRSYKVYAFKITSKCALFSLHSDSNSVYVL